jgi:hypothetical protein
MRTIIHKLILIAFFLAACQSSGAIEREPTSSPSATSTPIPNLTVKPLQTTETVQSHITNKQVIEIPDWIKKPHNNVLLLPLVENALQGSPSTFRLINPNNGEQMMLNLNRGYYFYYWKDASHIVFLGYGSCDEDGFPRHEYVAELNTFTGILWQGTEKEYTEPIKNCYQSPNEEEIVLNRGLPEITTEIKDPITGQTISLTSPNDGIGDVSYALSPNKNYIAIVQADGEYRPSEFWLPEHGDKVSIYNLSSRKHILTIEENERVSSLLIFLDNESLVYVRENTPCIVFLQSLEKKCIHAISEKFQNSAVIVESPLSTSRKLGFIHFTSSYGGICFYDLFSGNFNCPTDQFSNMKEQIITNYSLSPESKFILFEYDSEGCPIPWCDNFTDPHWAITDIEGNRLVELGESYTVGMTVFRPIQPDPWRPISQQ